MQQFTWEETITLVAKNPATLALFLSRALGEGYEAFLAGHISARSLMEAFEASQYMTNQFLDGTAHNCPPYRTFVANLIDSGEIEVTGELSRLSDPASRQDTRTVN